LLEDADELAKVSSGMNSFDQQVDVIGHKAVRNNRETLIVGMIRFRRHLLSRTMRGGVYDAATSE